MALELPGYRAEKVVTGVPGCRPWVIDKEQVQNCDEMRLRAGPTAVVPERGPARHTVFRDPIDMTDVVHLPAFFLKLPSSTPIMNL
jgi:hypothetical protein